MTDKVIVPIDSDVKDKANGVLKEHGTDVNHLLREVLVNIAASKGEIVAFSIHNGKVKSKQCTEDKATGFMTLTGYSESTLSYDLIKIPNEETELAMKECLEHKGTKYTSVETLMAGLNAGD